MRQVRPRQSPRERAVRRLAARLASGGWPRAEMALLVALTAVVGLLASFGLLALGLEAMAARYPLALAVAYGAFLLLIGVWVRERRRRRDWLDLADAPDAGAGGEPSPSDPEAGWDGGGGEFGGGGASGSFASEPDGPAGASLGDVADADEALVFLVPLALVALGAFGAAWIVWTAPILFAELLLDAALAAGLYRRLRGLERGGHWLAVAVRRTWLPALALAVVLAVAGFAMEHLVPGARSVGDFARGL